MKYPILESSEVEFKREIPQKDQIYKTIIGFCNQNGGKLYLGIADDGTVVGVDENEAHNHMEFLEKAILDISLPPIVTKIYSQRLGKKIIIIVEVAAGMNKPYYLKRDGLEHGVYVRVGRSTLLATPEMLTELRLEARGVAVEDTPVYRAQEADIDISKFKDFLEHRKVAQKKGKHSAISIAEALKAYGVIVEELGRIYPTVRGILLFGKDPQQFYSEARIMCNHFSGDEVGRKAIASQECLGTLDEQFDEAFNFVLDRLHKRWEIVGSRRREWHEIPVEAIREMIMNAVIHRNYNIPGCSKISIFNNRIEIFSPGGFLRPFVSLRDGFTMLRNDGICKVFREKGLIETFGLGFLTLFSSYEKAGLPEPTVYDGGNFIKCILPRETPDTKLRKVVTEDALETIMELFSRAGAIAVSDVVAQLHMARTTATRNLNKLVLEGRLKKVGKGRGVCYKKLR